MPKLPDYIGPVAFGVKMGVILPGTDLIGEITAVLKKAADDELLSACDVVCVTESVVARSQNNYVTIDRVAAEIKNKLQLAGASRIGVVFPVQPQPFLADPESHRPGGGRGRSCCPALFPLR